MAWKITANNGGVYPPKVQVDDETIELEGAELDAALPESCRVVGTIVYNGDYSKIKNKSFGGEWVEVNVGGGGETLPEHGVFFMDYDGSIVTAWDSSAVASKTALPDNPSHTGLVAQGWNWSLANIKSYISAYQNADVYVGQMYKTASGLTEIDITLTKVTGLTVTCEMEGNKDWGDGTIDALTSHTYLDYGDYTITCDGTSASGLLDINYGCTAIRIGDGVTSVADHAFAGCTSLTNITIPDGVTSIGEDAFNLCSHLTSITIPDSVTSIGREAFGDCYHLTNINISDSVTSVDDYAFSNCFSLTSITIPDSITSIGEGTFGDCRLIMNITIPDGITSIDNYAFNNCNRLTNINIPDGVTSIGEGTFSGCYSIMNITIPDSVTSIGDFAFSFCNSLTSITIPDSVTSIGESAFEGCFSLTSYDFSSATSVPTLSGPDVFSEINGLCKIIVPDALYNDWITATNWDAYADYIYKASEA